ncbi:hypothetical protein chiPu_0014882 [Chiloscyllium punctatum]|uniref:Uncharacterized protein n=1 Tax=Chiloscyllium punctatum TaxID=137246 RepID=A0A401T191_CHIPU|nr:hypothetical protein [Chiloscyllium punctatum]
MIQAVDFKGSLWKRQIAESKEELHRKEHQWLKMSLEQCHKQLNQGKGRRLILPLPALSDCQNISPDSAQGTFSASKSRVWSAKALSATEQQKEDMDDWVWVVSVPPLKSATYTVRSHPPIVSPEELEEVQLEKDEIEYRMNTVKERAARELRWKLDYHLPGYTAMLASRQNADSSLMETSPAAMSEVFETLSFPVKSCCRSYLSQAAKCGPARAEKPARARKHCRDNQEKNQEKIQQPLCGQNNRDQDKPAADPGWVVAHSSTSPGAVPMPVITTKLTQLSVTAIKSELTDDIAE